MEVSISVGQPRPEGAKNSENRHILGMDRRMGKNPGIEVVIERWTEWKIQVNLASAHRPPQVPSTVLYTVEFKR